MKKLKCFCWIYILKRVSRADTIETIETMEQQVPQIPSVAGPDAIARRVTPVDDDIQTQLDVVMSIVDENQDKITDGEYLRLMNALGSLHKHKRNGFGSRRRTGGSEVLEGWLSFEEMCEDEELYDEVMELADNIVVELCGEETSIYMSDTHNMVSRGDEDVVFDLVVNYKPEEGNAGYEVSPQLLHHAIQVIMARLFKDTHHELEIVRPVSCQCGWRGAQGNWDRHIRNARHQRWVVASEENRKAAIRAAAAALENDEEYQVSQTYQMLMAPEAEAVSSPSALASASASDSNVVYIYEEHWTPESQTRTDAIIAAAETAGKRVVFIAATTHEHFIRTRPNGWESLV